MGAEAQGPATLGHQGNVHPGQLHHANCNGFQCHPGLFLNRAHKVVDNRVGSCTRSNVQHVSQGGTLDGHVLTPEHGRDEFVDGLLLVPCFCSSNGMHRARIQWHCYRQHGTRSTPGGHPVLSGGRQGPGRLHAQGAWAVFHGAAQALPSIFFPLCN